MSDSIRVTNAKGLYLEGIRDGNMRAALDKYTGARYTQHSTGVRDGKEGFIEFFTAFIERNPIRDIQIKRVIEDGQYVFVHVYQNLNNGAAEWVTADIFDTDEDGRIIEHWDVIAPYTWPTTSGRSMVDGPSQIEDEHLTDANKALVHRYIDEVLIGGKTDAASDYISGEMFHQHNPALPDGLDALTKHTQEVVAGQPPARYTKVHRVLGQGNFVAVFSEVQKGGDDWAVIDIFRLAGGKIVEQWDVQEQIGPPETWTNSGKF